MYRKPYRGHKEIRRYWQKKVVGEQSRIRFNLKSLYVDGNTAVAEWEATFDDTKKKVRTNLKEIAVLKIKNGKIQSLREYWHSKHTK